jgi:hypothetical protein
MAKRSCTVIKRSRTKALSIFDLLLVWFSRLSFTHTFSPVVCSSPRLRHTHTHVLSLPSPQISHTHSTAFVLLYSYTLKQQSHTHTYPNLPTTSSQVATGACRIVGPFGVGRESGPHPITKGGLALRLSDSNLYVVSGISTFVLAMMTR